VTFLFTGCGGPPKSTNSEGVLSEEVEKDESEIVTVETEETAEVTDIEVSKDTEISSSSDFKTITDITNYWSDLYSVNEAVLNAYEGMPIMETVTPALCFITGVQYDMLNVNNIDGRFEGELMLAGFQGFVDKNGSNLTFGYDDKLKEDGFSPSMKAGDRQVENGSCNLEKGYFFSDSYTERDGVMIDRTTSEFKVQEDGSMCTIVMSGRTLDYNNEESFSTSYIFIRNGKGQYDIAVASAAIGTDYTFLTLKDNMTKEDAIAAFEAAGATIESNAGISEGAFALE